MQKIIIPVKELEREFVEVGQQMRQSGLSRGNLGRGALSNT